jgi:hypothetical protein
MITLDENHVLTETRYFKTKNTPFINEEDIWNDKEAWNIAKDLLPNISKEFEKIISEILTK